MRQLSGGMKRRVGLIQALLNNPDFLIIDEPHTGLDPEERIRIRNLLVDFSKDRTVLFSTHVVEDLAATCTQLAIMKKGSFLYSGRDVDKRQRLLLGCLSIRSYPFSCAAEEVRYSFFFPTLWPYCFSHKMCIRDRIICLQN